jgi:myo-inositol-1(or 4)-monophosphatase
MFLFMDKKLLSLMKKAAIAGGDVLLKHFYADRTISKKRNDDEAIGVDIVAERMIIKIVENIFPKHNIISEEKGKIDKQSEYTWTIHPLDGTGNFIRHIPIFGNSIALEYKGETIMGIVYLPMTKELFSAFRGEGAYRNNEPLSRLQPSKKKPEELFITFSHGQKPEDIKKMMDYFQKIRPHVSDMRKLGASTVEITSVVRGAIDAYIAPGLPIGNFQAASLIVTEVGGTVRTSKDGTIYIFAPGVEQIISKSLR